MLSKSFSVHCSRQGRCILRRGSWLGTWWNLFRLIWMRRFDSFKQIAICLIFSRYHYSHGNQELWLMMLLRGPSSYFKSTTFWLFSFSCECCRFTQHSLDFPPLQALVWISLKRIHFSRHASCPISLSHQNFSRFWKHWVSKFKVFMRGRKRNWLMEMSSLSTESSFWNWLFDCPPPWWAEGSFDGRWQKRWCHIKHEDQTQKINRDKAKNC